MAAAQVIDADLTPHGGFSLAKSLLAGDLILGIVWMKGVTIPTMSFAGVAVPSLEVSAPTTIPGSGSQQYLHVFGEQLNADADGTLAMGGLGATSDQMHGYALVRGCNPTDAIRQLALATANSQSAAVELADAESGDLLLIGAGWLFNNATGITAGAPRAPAVEIDQETFNDASGQSDRAALWASYVAPANGPLTIAVDGYGVDRFWLAAALAIRPAGDPANRGAVRHLVPGFRGRIR